jgi:hypothetical protein
MPRLFLHIEGAIVLLTACVFYAHLRASWLWFAVLFLAPDISMLGYLAGKKAGAMLYNLAHTYTVPALAAVALFSSGHGAYLWLVVIWGAHIGFDRLLGYGLKYETAFKDTHLQKV